MFDLVIRNGTVIDGSGAPRKVADVAVQDGRIAAVGPKLGPARREIEAGGLIVAPGFVDAHRHVWQTQLRTVATDWSLLDYLVHMRMIASTFYTADDGQGAGLGLAIASELAERMSGKLSVESRPRSTTLTLELPV